MSGYDLTSDQDREDRRKHLDLVSSIVGRMAGASAAAKGWSITLAGAAFGVAVVRGSWYLFALGVVGLVVFGVIDGLYLHNERKFRDLYEAIVQNSIAPFSMSTTSLTVRPKSRSYVSWSVLGFYGPLVLAGLILLIASLINPGCHNDHTPSPIPNPPVTTSSIPIPPVTTSSIPIPPWTRPPSSDSLGPS